MEADEPSTAKYCDRSKLKGCPCVAFTVTSGVGEADGVLDGTGLDKLAAASTSISTGT